MNLKTIVKISNIVALVCIVLLIYWVFTFISIEVFGLRIFRENLSQIFAQSILGMMALMGGSLILNVMFNMTRIAQKHNADVLSEPTKSSKLWMILLIASFPLLFLGLLGGDHLTSKKKENMLISSANLVIERNKSRTDQVVDYRFDSNWLINTDETLSFFEKTEQSFPNVSVIVKDNLDGADVFMAFREYSPSLDESNKVIEPNKDRFLLRTTLEEREYLTKVFDQNYNERWFEASDGNYRLFYPYRNNGKVVVLFFSDYQRYGKMGS